MQKTETIAKLSGLEPRSCGLIILFLVCEGTPKNHCGVFCKLLKRDPTVVFTELNVFLEKVKF